MDDIFYVGSKYCGLKVGKVAKMMELHLQKRDLLFKIVDFPYYSFRSEKLYFLENVLTLRLKDEGVCIEDIKKCEETIMGRCIREDFLKILKSSKDYSDLMKKVKEFVTS